ncbi:MAG: tetratricopeptide repeat protein [Polyangiales bacterium]
MLRVTCLFVLVSLCSSCATNTPRTPVRAVARCLDAVSGDAVDSRLLRAQAALGQRAWDPAAWVAAGDAWVLLARARSQPQLFAAADDCAAQALERAPQHAPAQRLRGLVWMNAHRFAEARDLARELVARDPSDSLSWGTLSDAELELGNLSAATEAGQMMLDQKPSLLSYGRAAHLRWLSGDRSGANALYKLAIAAGRQQPDREPSAWMLVQAAWVFWHERDYVGAQRGFELALSELPRYAPALEGLGRAALARHQPAEAVRWLERAQALHPLAETAWRLGDAYAAIGDNAAAARAYREVVQLGQHDPRTLSLFYATRGEQAAEAQRLAELAFRERQDIYSKDALAFASYRSGQRATATRLAREIMESGIPDSQVRERARLILVEPGRQP